MKRLITAAFAALALSACATQTPYEPASKQTGGRGYTETQFARWSSSTCFSTAPS
jgi:PBP1b-binding outer membrane lipoprotein LpoB